MRLIMLRALLLALVLTALIQPLCAQDADEFIIGSDQPGLLTDGMPGVGNLLPMQDLLSTEESLSTESGGGPSPGPLPV